MTSSLDGFLGLGGLCEAWKQLLSNFGYRLTIHQLKSLIKSVRANNATATGVHKDAAHTGFGWQITGFVELREISVVIKDQVDDHILFFVGFHLCLEQLLIFVSCLGQDTLDNGGIALTASNVNFGLHESDESLHDEILDEITVFIWLLLLCLNECDSCLLV